MNHLKLIIKREYFTRVKNKSFLIMTVLTPIIMIALIAFIGYISQVSANKERTIAILDPSNAIAPAFVNTKHITYKILNITALEQAKAEVQNKEYYGLLYVPDMPLSELKNQIHFFSKDTPSINIISDIESKIEKRLTNFNFKANGLDINLINDSQIFVDIIQETFSGEQTSKEESVIKIAFGSIAGYLLFMFIIIYGNMIMRSVIEEKTSRVIEVIVSSVKPIQLMLGKIIGTSLAGITQFVVWLVLGFVLIVVAGLIFNVNISDSLSVQPELVDQAIQQNINLEAQVQTIIQGISNLPLLNLIIAFLFFFIAGYLLYSSLYAAIGAAVDNETDTQQFMLPILTPLILAVYVGIATVVDDPHGTISTVFSFIPFTSPVVMLMRIPFGVPVWQQALSFLLLAGTFILVVWFAAKIYRVGILMYGKKPSYKELLKWIKY